jgi:hypothetical protein
VAYVKLQAEAEDVLSSTLAQLLTNPDWLACIVPGAVAVVQTMQRPSAELSVILGTRGQLVSLAQGDDEARADARGGGSRGGTRGSAESVLPGTPIYALSLHVPHELDPGDARRPAQDDPFAGMKPIHRSWGPPPLPMCAAPHPVTPVCLATTCPCQCSQSICTKRVSQLPHRISANNQ